MDEKTKAEEYSNDLVENTEGSKKIMSQGLSELEVTKIADQATNCINATDESESSFGSNSIGINEKNDFKAIFEQCTANVHKITNEAIENINLKLTTIFYSSSERDSERINIEDMPVASTEGSEIVAQETGSMTEESKAFTKHSFAGFSEMMDQETNGMTEESKAFPKTSYEIFCVVMDQENDGMEGVTKAFLKPSFVGCSEIMNQETDGMTEEPKAFLKPSYARFSKVMDKKNDGMMEESKVFPNPSIVGFSDVMNQESGGMIEESKVFAEPSVARCSKVLISEEVNKIAYRATTSTNITDESDIILRTNSVVNNQITEFEKNFEQCTTEVNAEIGEAVEIVNVTTFAPSSKEGREKRNLKIIFVPSKEDGEIMYEAIECVNMPGTSKVTATFNAEKVDETANPDESTAIFATESVENLETVNAEEKVISGPKRKTRKRKAPPIAEMVMASIKKVKRSDGVSFEDIKNHMEENYPVKVKALIKYHALNFLQKFVDKGFLDKTDGADSERFIIKRSGFMEI